VSAIRLRGVSKSFDGRTVFAGIDLDIAAGQFVSIIGPSGSGKSTLLRIMAGLEPATAGTVEVSGRPAAEARVSKHVAMVPQQPGLLPWRTVEANARLLVDVNRRANGSSSRSTADGRAAAVVELLHEVGLGDALRLYPHQLSGGMQQRVALVRALALGAPLLMLDEPFAALDEITRADMRDLLNRLVEQHCTSADGAGPVTTVLVTHSVSEAVALSDRVLVVSARPARIVSDIAIALPRPRPEDLDDDPAFIALCRTVRHALRFGTAGEQPGGVTE
jgi:NitT/TauT family transport system ATP-binding protein